MAVINSIAFWAPGKLYVPGDDGKRIEINFRARYKRLKKSERMALDHRIEANKLTTEMRASLRARLDKKEEVIADDSRKYLEAVLAAKPITDAEFLRTTLVDLDLKDTEGQPIIYTPNAVAELEEELDGFEAALVRIYYRAREAASNPMDAEKNSETQSGTTSS